MVRQFKIKLRHSGAERIRKEKLASK